MGELGSVIPLAFGVAISPVPIIAVILMLMSPRARETSSGFALGWFLGIAGATSITTLLAATLVESSSSGGSLAGGLLQMAFGLVLLALATRQWRSRPRQGQEPNLPAWMGRIDTLRFPMALVLGLVLSVVNPKNLLMAVSAGAEIGGAEPQPLDAVGAIGVFTLLAVSTVLAPVVAYFVAARRLRPALESLRRWLVRENAVIMTVILLLIGAVVVGQGITTIASTG